jgi:integrase
MRALIADGTDPIEQKKQAKQAAVAATIAATPFSEALSAYTQAFAGKSTTVELEGLITRHVPALLPRPLTSIMTQDVLTALSPVQASLPKTAARVRNAISIVYDYAIARGMHTSANPASRTVFKFLLPAPPRSKPHRMYPISEIPALYARLGEKASASRLCLQWLILTCSRSQEAIRVEWTDIDLARCLWTVPPHKIKMKRVHRVPLATQALEVLAQARALFPNSGYVFSGLTRGDSLCDRALECVLRRQMGEPYPVHGLRATFSSWCNETQPFAFEDVEACLAHQVGNAVSRAYDRSERIAKRAVILHADSDEAARL